MVGSGTTGGTRTSRAFGDRIRALRRGRGLRVREIADAVGLTTAQLSRLERGGAEPDDGAIAALSQYFATPADELLLAAGRLPDDLRAILQQHPVESAQLLRERFAARPATPPAPVAAPFLPAELITAVATWAVRSRDDIVLDPNCGNGEWLAAAARRLLALGATAGATLDHVHGYSADGEAAARTVRALREVTGGTTRLVRRDDFLTAEPLSRLPFARVAPPAAHALIGVVGGDRTTDAAARAHARAVAAESGVALPETAAPWAAVVGHAASFVRPEGRIALLLPSALLRAQYAAAVRSYLAQLFPALTVISFTSPLPGLGDAVLVLGDSTGEPGIRSLRVGDPAQLESALPRITGAPTHVAEARPLRWSSASLPSPGVAVLHQLQRDRVLVRLGDVAAITVGVVTGANEFFILDRKTAERFDAAVLRPLLTAATAAPGLLFTTDDWHRATSGSHLLCLDAGSARASATRRYIKAGERRGFAERATCRRRPLWYVLPRADTPAAFLTYMSPHVPRMIVNTAGVTHTNALYGVQPRRGVSIAALAAAFLSSATLLGCETLGHRYGNGVLKLDPSEVHNLLVPDPRRAAAHGAEWLEAADALWRARQLDDAVRLIDQRFLCQEMGVPARVVHELQERYVAERTRRRAAR